ncbi:unnamed protein product [Natator depressus]
MRTRRGGVSELTKGFEVHRVPHSNSVAERSQFHPQTRMEEDTFSSSGARLATLPHPRVVSEPRV